MVHIVTGIVSFMGTFHINDDSSLSLNCVIKKAFSKEHLKLTSAFTTTNKLAASRKKDIEIRLFHILVSLLLNGDTLTWANQIIFTSVFMRG